MMQQYVDAKMEKDCLCIIGARKRSKRLPGKNRLSLGNKPLFSIVLDAARNASFIDTIIFSTDDEIILSELSDFDNIIIDKRPDFLAEDHIPMWEVDFYLIQKYERLIPHINTLCLLTPCHPFRTAEHATSLISVTPFPSPPVFALDVKDGRARRDWTGLVRKSEQPDKYYPNGAIMIVKRDYFLDNRTVYSPDTLAFEMDWPYSLDIDHEEDYNLAKMLVGVLE